MTVDREVARDAVGALFNTALVGAGLPCAQVLSYPPKSFQGCDFPLAYIENAASRRSLDTNTGDKSWFDFDLTVLVPYPDDALASSATVEDTLDAVEKLIATTVQTRTNQNTANWTLIKFRDSSRPDYLNIGKVYRVETHFLTIKMRDI